MDIASVLKREEAKLQKQVSNLKQQLDRVRAAVKALGGTTSNGRSGGRKKRTLSPAGRARIAKATRARWARYHAEKNKKSKAA